MHFLSVFVRSREKKDIVAGETAVSGKHVGGYGRIGMSDMGYVVDIVNGGGDVELLAHLPSASSSSHSIPVVFVVQGKRFSLILGQDVTV